MKQTKKIKKLKEEIKLLEKGLTFLGRSAGKRKKIHFSYKQEIINKKKEELKQAIKEGEGK